MSLPPQTIRVKRKRGTEETPVTFLSFEQGEIKRHRSGTRWAYQRKDTAAKTVSSSPSKISSTSNTRVPRDAPPVIHVSGSAATSAPPKQDGQSRDKSPLRTIARAKSPASASRRSAGERRKFHMSRSSLNSASAQSGGIAKYARQNAAVFVERNRKKHAHTAAAEASQDIQSASEGDQRLLKADAQATLPESKSLKKPSSTSRLRSKDGEVRTTQQSKPPPSVNRVDQDLDEIASQMNQWVLSEIGANLESIEKEKQEEANMSKFRPRPVANRYSERHPPPPPPSTNIFASGTPEGDETATDDDDDDDWIIDEYVRIPVDMMAVDVNSGDVGILVLDGDKDTTLFYGPDNGVEDDWLEDDEDENAEDYYTADYPEDEVDSDDEFGRRAYDYRTRLGSDDEEFDAGDFSDADGDDDDDDGMILEGDVDADDAALRARLRRHLQRGGAFR